ncbi:MAG: helix-turn-helix domain-containing protein [Nanoarchaeota archaeon]|nr:helix-turn-helix domain-containing protein [Nanoarchaeota archaeon]
MIESSLKKIGLTDGEIKIYLSLLELGSSTTWNITKKSGVSGSKVYEVLDRLAKKGLVSHITRNNVKYFESASPEKILDYLEIKSNEIESDKNEIKKIIPSLILKQTNSAKAEVKVFTGFEGAKTVYDINVKDCKKGDEMVGWGLTDQPKSWESYFNEKEKIRDKRGIIYKMVLNEKYKSLYDARKNYKNTYFRFFPKELEMPTSVLVWKNKVALYVVTEQPITILIESEAVANSFKKYFNIMWSQAKKITHNL